MARIRERLPEPVRKVLRRTKAVVRGAAPSGGGEMAELRRILNDEVNARNEVTAILGRTVARLTDEVEDLREQVRRLSAKAAK